MGETKGSLEVRTKVEAGKIFTETRATVEDSDGDPEIMRYASGINVKIAGILTKIQAMEASGCYLPFSPKKLLEGYIRKN